MAQSDMPIVPQTGDPRFRNQEAATYLRVSPKTLNVWRTYRKGPKYLKVGRLIFYRKSDLDAWMVENTIDPEAS